MRRLIKHCCDVRPASTDLRWAFWQSFFARSAEGRRTVIDPPAPLSFEGVAPRAWVAFLDGYEDNAQAPLLTPSRPFWNVAFPNYVLGPMPGSCLGVDGSSASPPSTARVLSSLQYGAVEVRVVGRGLKPNLRPCVCRTSGMSRIGVNQITKEGISGLETALSRCTRTVVQHPIGLAEGQPSDPLFGS